MEIELTGRQLHEGEIRPCIALAILKAHETTGYVLPNELVNPDSVANILELRGQTAQQFGRNNKGLFPKSANDFINRLISAGILQRDWTGYSQNQYLLNEGRAPSLEALTTLEGITNLEVIESLEDAELRSRCEPLVWTGVEPDQLIREAATVLEARLRSLLPQSERTSVQRRNLAGRVFKSEPPIVTIADGRLNDEFHYLVRGLIGFYGTEIHHGIIRTIDRTARRFLNMVDEVLTVISEETAKSN